MIDLTPSQLPIDEASGGISFEHRLDPLGVGDQPVPVIAEQLPRAWIRLSPAWPEFTEARRTRSPADDEDPVALVETIATSETSVRLYHLDHVGPVQQLAARLRTVVADLCPVVEQVDLALFLAPPGAVTPAHPDRHHNLLLQLRGTKQVWVEDLSASSPLEHHRRTIDYFADPSKPLVRLPPASTFVLGPGEGVYIPPGAFHWTRVTTDGDSMALSVGFRTPQTRRATRLSYFDSRLRSFGWRPRPSGPVKRSLVAMIDAVRRRPASLR